MNNKKRFSTKLTSVFLTLVLLLSLFPASVLTPALAADGEEMVFATISDIHYFAQADRGNNSEAMSTALGQPYDQILQLDSLLDACFETVKKLAAEKGLKYLLISGDLTFDGEKAGHTELASILKKFEEESGVKVFLINGNHDINNAKACTFKNGTRQEAALTSPEDFISIYSDLVYGLKNVERYTPPMYAQSGMLSYAVSLEGGYRLIALDTCKYSFDVTDSGYDGGETAGCISDDLMNWIAGQVKTAQAKGETVIAMGHHNVVPMNYLQENLTPSFIVDNAAETAEALADIGVHYLFTGHSHSTDISRAYSDNGEVIYNIQTSAFSAFPNAMRVTTFTKNQGSVTANFEICEPDITKQITAGDVTYDQPYREASFGISYKDGDPTEYLMNYFWGKLEGVLKNIKARGGLLGHIEYLSGLKIEDSIRTLFFMDIKIPDTNYTVLSADNVINFLSDFLSQLEKKYVDNPDNLYKLVEELTAAVCDLPISDYPCSKFVDTYGFGSKTEPGTVGELMLSSIVYMYSGNEDVSDDAFVKDVIERCYSGELIKKLLNTAVEAFLRDALQDEILSDIYLDVSALFAGMPSYVGAGAQAALKLFLGGDLSYLNVINKILGIAKLEYGTTIDEVIDYLVDEYLTDSVYEGIGYQVGLAAEGCCTDDTPDYDVKYTYSGPVEIVPTQEDYRLPTMASVVFGTDPKTSFNISWYTKTSVTGTDIELVKVSGTSLPRFTGKPTTGKNIKAKTDEVLREYPGIDFVVFGMLPIEKTLNRHTIRLTELEPGTKYYFRIGDAEKGWWSETGLLETSGSGNSFRFMYVSDTQSVTPTQYNNTWGNLAQKAFEKYGGFDFIIHGGDFVDNGNNLNQWQWCLDAASKQLLSAPIVSASGNHETSGENAILNYFMLENYPEQDTTDGVYFSFEYENAYFAVLNSNDQTSKGALSKKQTDWLKADAAASDAMWKIVVIHKAPYSNGPHIDDSDVTALRNQLSTLMPELSIDLVLQGHDHVYLRTDLLKNNAAVFTSKNVAVVDDYPVETLSGDGTVYVISGKAGVKSYDQLDNDSIVENMPVPKKSLNTQNPIFSSIKIDNDVLFFEAYEVNGDDVNRVDIFALQKDAADLMMGDLNFDGQITATDARIALRASAQLERLSDIETQVADVNLDGKVAASDARKILRVSSKLDSFEKEYITVHTSNPAFS